jgi:hypothetical protein
MKPDNLGIRRSCRTSSESARRGVYMVFDHENHERWVAESANCGENIVAIEKGKFRVPRIPSCADGAKRTNSVGYAPPPAPTAPN